MKLGLMMAVLGGMKLNEALDQVKALGLDTVEIGTGAYPGDPHCDVKTLLRNEKKREEFLEAIRSRGLEISAFACHGNMLHPDPAIGKVHDRVFNDTILLAEKCGVKVINNFSGTPAGSPTDKVPNWIVCPWPPDFAEALKYQWEKKLIPYWKKMNRVLGDHGVKAALEMHPNFCVYNPETLLRLRQECGKNIGCNFDPSHLFWQGIDPCAALRVLKEAVFHVHAKDTKIYDWNCKVNGVLDTKSYLDEVNRSWIFRSVGYGHGWDFWADFVSTLRLIGYDGTLSIEHEDSLMSGPEGLDKALKVLKDLVIREKAGAAWWA